MTNTRLDLNTNQMHSSTYTMLLAMPLQKTYRVQVSQLIDDKKVTLNRNNKLFGTYGETIVIFHHETALLGQFIRLLQQKIIAKFGEATQAINKELFINIEGEKASPTSFSPIQNPHTTLIAMRVIDAYDQQSWNQRLVQSYLYAKLSQYQQTPEELETYTNLKTDILNNNLDNILNSSNDSIIRKILNIDENTVIKDYLITQSHFPILHRAHEKVILDTIQMNPIIHLKIDSVSLNGNGSLGIKWQKNNEILSLRRALSDLGGMAKHGDEIITTTIGYFPYCNESNKKEIEIYLIEILQELIQFKFKFDLNLNDAQLVKFSRNDLHPNYIKTVPLIKNDQLILDNTSTEFPELKPSQFPSHLRI